MSHGRMWIGVAIVALVTTGLGWSCYERFGVYGHCRAESSYGPFSGMAANRDAESGNWTVDVGDFGPSLPATQPSSRQSP